MDFPAAHLSLPMGAVPPSVPRHSVASHATRSPLSPHCNPFSARSGQPRCFPPQSSRLFSLFCKPGFRGRSNGPSGQRAPPVVPPSTRLTQGRLRLHTALRPGNRTDAPHCRFNQLLRTRAGIPRWEYVRAQEQVSTETGSSSPCHWKAPCPRKRRQSQASPQHPPETGRIKQAPEVSSVCPSEDF